MLGMVVSAKRKARQLLTVNNRQALLTSVSVFAELSAMNFTPLRARALRSNVGSVLRDALLDGRFQLGQDISDVTLAAEFGVSRGPIREALLSLVGEGLLEHHHNRGFRVPCLSADDLRQISTVRLPLEAMALELARQTATPADLEKLQQLKAEMLSVFNISYPLGPRRQDLAFHAVIWSLAKNPWLETALTRLCLSYLIYSPSTGLVDKPLAMSVLNEIHTVYIDYLAGKSALTALECVKVHIELGGSTSIL